MTRFGKLLLVTAGAIALCGVQACSSGTELNPQPLPPADPQHEPGSADKGATTGGGSSGGSSTPAPSAADAGAEGGDASDCGGDR